MKTSYDELYALCEAHDIVILQETWLAKNELSLLSNTHCDFIGNGVSSIDDELKLNSGRPHGGIGILWRKHMNKHCTVVTVFIAHFSRVIHSAEIDRLTAL